jgi:hypothetical protein
MRTQKEYGRREDRGGYCIFELLVSKFSVKRTKEKLEIEIADALA